MALTDAVEMESDCFGTPFLFQLSLYHFYHRINCAVVDFETTSGLASYSLCVGCGECTKMSSVLSKR
jgi:hypothetical protein